jgi:hypothetical protein
MKKIHTIFIVSHTILLLSIIHSCSTYTSARPYKATDQLLPATAVDCSSSSSTQISQPTIPINVPGFTTQITRLTSNEDTADVKNSVSQAMKNSDSEGHKKRGRKQI